MPEWVVLCILFAVGIVICSYASSNEDIVGPGYHIYRPWIHINKHHALRTIKPLIASPKEWIRVYDRKLEELSSQLRTTDDKQYTARAQRIYFRILESFLTATIFGEDEVSIIPALGVNKMSSKPLDLNMRKSGTDLTGLGMTMIGQTRMNNLRTLLEDIFLRDVPGDIMETGVWRGGASIFARAIVQSYEQRHRVSYICDSFAGLPHSQLKEDTKYGDWDNTPILEVGDVDVLKNFKEYNVIDTNVVFVKGFFNSTMPALQRMHVSYSSSLPTTEVLFGGNNSTGAGRVSNFRDKNTNHSLTVYGQQQQQQQQFNNITRTARQPYFPRNIELALLRMDGDMYESTVDVLYHMYDKVVLGGYVIVDDWTNFPAKDACMDFFQVHNLNPNILPIDSSSAYWRKDKAIEIQYWRYEQKQFRSSQG